jgi:hypothetical protein
MVFDFFRLNVTRATAARVYNTSELYQKKKKQPHCKTLTQTLQETENQQCRQKQYTKCLLPHLHNTQKLQISQKIKTPRSYDNSKGTHCKTLTLILHETEHQHCNRIYSLSFTTLRTPKSKRNSKEKFRTPRFYNNYTKEKPSQNNSARNRVPTLPQKQHTNTSTPSP